MTKPKLVRFPAYNLDTDPIKRAFTRVEAAIDDKQDYRQITNLASTALARMEESQLMMLNLRAYALSMQGRFDDAVKDAQSIIEINPISPAGYIRLGTIYGTQGKQLSAIETYDIGLQSISMDHPDYIQMVESRESATRQSEARVDFVAMLPVEVIDGIFTLLSAKWKIICLEVSSVWRNKIFSCSNAWKTLRSDEDTEDCQIASVMPHIAGQVEDLIINTSDCRVFTEYLLGMNGGMFNKIKSLTITEATCGKIDSFNLMTVTSGFWQIRYTITKLVISTFSHSDHPITPLFDLLSIFANLKALEYSTTVPLSDAMGRLTPLKPYDNLVDMQLKSRSIIRQDIERLLPHCRQLLRLILTGCFDITILDIIDTICPSLETFGYNPQIEKVEKLDYPNSRRQVPRGLCRFYTSNGVDIVPASAVLPLIRRNMDTLKVVYAYISPDVPQQDLTAMYADLKLKNLERLTYWGGIPDTIQPLLLRSVSTCTTLTHVETVASRNISAVINTILKLPRLESFEISHDHYTSPGETSFIRLFEFYSMVSVSKRQLRNLWLRYCKTIVTDEVLDALAGIRTLETIQFEGLTNVSAYALNNFFEQHKNNIVYIKLMKMDTITDNTLSRISKNAKCLTEIHLETLENVSDYGVMGLIERAPKLQNLALIECRCVTRTAIAYAKKVLNSVVTT